MCKVRIVQKRGKDLDWKTRELMIKEYLSSGKSKQFIWEKYTGQKIEHGQILKWMRILGYEESPRKSKILYLPDMSKAAKKEEEYFENLQLKKRVAALELSLKDAEMKAIAYSTMIDIAEENFNINIRKKSLTKPSKK